MTSCKVANTFFSQVVIVIGSGAGVQGIKPRLWQQNFFCVRPVQFYFFTTTHYYESVVRNKLSYYNKQEKSI